MHDLRKTIGGTAAVVVLVGVLATGIPRQAGAQAQGATAQATPAAQTQGEQPPQQQKKPKDQGEFDIYNEVIKDVQAQNWNKAITDLDTWKQKYPDSDFKYDRLYFYMQAYNGARQPAKVLDTATELFSKDPKTEFNDPKNGPQQVVTVDFLTAANVQHIPNPSPEQLATAEKAARNLLDYTPTFFSAARKPAATSEADWNKARTDLEAVGKGALNYIALRPGAEAMQRKDYNAAIQAYAKALQDYPDSAAVSYALGSALISSRKPENISQGIYQVARAAALDPSKGGLTDPKARTEVENYLKKIYTTIHGSTEGLDQVKQVAVNTPTPPPDFKVKTQAEIDLERDQELEKTDPQRALWMKIKGLLVDTNGEQYFQSSLKETEVTGQRGAKALKGVVVDGKPACRSKEILVGIREPNQQGTPKAEISLKLAAALTGKPVPGTEIQFNGVPSAFTKEPFLLTMDTDKAKIDGLKEERCAVAPARGTKKGVTKKKK